jgi:hypothetical protein
MKEMMYAPFTWRRWWYRSHRYRLNGGIFPGGGGGSSTYTTGGLATPGGNGGGIVIMICDTLKGNGNRIIADGHIRLQQMVLQVPEEVAAVDLLLYTFKVIPHFGYFGSEYFSQRRTGGNHLENSGNGGGGGGGLIATNSITLPVNVIKSVTGGSVGTRSGGAAALHQGRTESARSPFVHA